MQKRTGRQTWRPERVVRAAGCVSGDAAARADCAGGGSPILVSFSMNDRSTLFADTVITLLRLERWDVLFTNVAG